MTVIAALQKELVVSHQARGQFLNSFSSLQQEFDAAQRRAREQEKRLMQDQKQVAKKLEQLVNDAQGKLADDQPLSQLCHKWLKDTRQVTGQWLQAAQQFDKGTQLNDQCQGSFVAYVLGKVNSGKSSLGNYIATGQHKPSVERVKALKQQDLNFVLHEQSTVQTRKKQSLAQGFVVDDQECTSSIQSFSLPGLTWVDVPGLHSKNAANGELAAEYLQSADLVVYVMNAEHPARESDMAEIGKLLEMEKPLVFVLTCSDEMLQDEIDGQLVCQRTMYSRQDRHAQNQYLLNTLKRHFDGHPGLEQVHAVSVSVRYAEEAGEDAVKLDDSGIPEFLYMMQGLIERDSVQIKKQTPVNNLAHFARRLITASQLLGQQHRQIYEVMQQLNQDVESRYQGMVGQMTTELNIIIAQEMQHYGGDNKTLSKNIAEKLRASCFTKVEQALTEQLTELERVVAPTFSFDSSEDLLGFTYEYESFSYSDSGKKRAWGATGGTAFGTVTGAMVGGPIGAMVGGLIGGALGKLAGDALATDYSRQVIVGDNRYQVEEAAYTLFSQKIQRQLDQIYRTPVLQVTAQLNHALQTAESELQQFCQRHQSLV
ncbi:dynamin family protein [Vibrio cincinnatiensis]|uniref:dynamin family protein n=1 Tax=Vibrio cincinnatiensis TaxID=675 RepID=UPI001EDF22C7|nr:dynamin family protein [Vibrio cincinnatiensis]